MLRDDLYKPWFVGNDSWGVEILRDQFSGVVLQINSVEFSKTQPDGVDLDYNIVNKPDTVSDGDLASDEFNQLMSMILTDILNEAIALNNEQNRTNDTQESS